VPPKSSCLHLLCEQFEVEWTSFVKARSHEEESRSSNGEEARSSQNDDEDDICSSNEAAWLSESSDKEEARCSSNQEAWSAPGNLNFDGVIEDDDILPNLKKNKRKYQFTRLGQQTHLMPNGWKRCHRLHLSHLEEKEEVVKNIQAAAIKERCCPEEEQQFIVGTFAARWPQVSDTAVEQLLAAGGIQLAYQTKLIIEFDDVVESLEPSHTYVTNAVINTAAHKVIVNAVAWRKQRGYTLAVTREKGSSSRWPSSGVLKPEGLLS
jgi:hypothetical protein